MAGSSGYRSVRSQPDGPVRSDPFAAGGSDCCVWGLQGDGSAGGVAPDGSGVAHINPSTGGALYPSLSYWEEGLFMLPAGLWRINGILSVSFPDTTPAFAGSASASLYVSTPWGAEEVAQGGKATGYATVPAGRPRMQIPIQGVVLQSEFWHPEFQLWNDTTEAMHMSVVLAFMGSSCACPHNSTSGST